VFIRFKIFFLVAGRVTYVCSTIEEFVRDNPEMKKFDAVVASEVIEHVDNPPHFVSTCASILDEGGSFFLTTINRTQRSYVGAIMCAEYILGLLPTGTHDWNKFITPQELENMLKDSGYPFRVRLVNGMFYFPFFDKWTWIPDTGVNYVLHAVKTDS
jgi:polyprenyldihydroxybenzoate methyltransferase/3-demethylubiquinol 3-O-methyltransferase